MIHKRGGTGAAFRSLPAIGPDGQKQSRRHFSPAASSIQTVLQSGELQIDGLRAATVLLDRERHFRAFFKRRKTGALDCGNVDENILAAIFRRDEAEATGRIKELYGAILAHGDIPFPYVGRKDRNNICVLASKVGKGSLAGSIRTDDPTAVLTECPRIGRSNISTYQQFAFGPDRPETQ
jgi:hypothetical protein